MNKGRYTIIRGLNGEIKDIIDYCKGDKHLCISDFLTQVNEQDKAFKKLKKENEQLKQQIKNLRINVLDSIREADEIKCTCNPCIVEECVRKVVE